MIYDTLNDKIIERILSKREHHASYTELVAGFEEKLAGIDFTNHPVSVDAYFGERKNKSYAYKALKEVDYIKGLGVTNETLPKMKDFMGIYFFIHETTPFYVGISRKVLERIAQHVKGHDRNTSSLAYRIAKIRYQLLYNVEPTETKTKEWFIEFVKPAQQFLLQQKVVFRPISNHEELYLFEVFCSMKFGTSLNLFETH